MVAFQDVYVSLRSIVPVALACGTSSEVEEFCNETYEGFSSAIAPGNKTWKLIAYH